MASVIIRITLSYPLNIERKVSEAPSALKSITHSEPVSPMKIKFSVRRHRYGQRKEV